MSRRHSFDVSHLSRFFRSQALSRITETSEKHAFSDQSAPAHGGWEIADVRDVWVSAMQDTKELVGAAPQALAQHVREARASSEKSLKELRTRWILALAMLAVGACSKPVASTPAPPAPAPADPTPSDPPPTPAPDPAPAPSPDPAPAPDPVPPPVTDPISDPSKIMWKGDFSTGDISQWSSPQSWSPNQQNWDASRLTVVTNHPPNGSAHALKVTLKAGELTYNYNHSPPYPMNARSELTHSTPLKEGDERWYRWKAWFPADFAVEDGKGGGAVFTQWHHYNASQGEPGSPPLLFVATTSNLELHHVPYLNSGSDEILWHTPLAKDRWHTFVFHVKFSSNAAAGLVELSLDGEKVLTKNTNTLFSGFTDYLKVGLYRRPNATPDNVIYLSDMVEASAQGGVM